MSTKFRYAVTAMAAAAVMTGCHKSNKEQADLTAQAKTAAEASGYRPPDDGSTEVLHVYTWSDYISPDVIAQFEKSFDNQVKVKIDTFDSN